MLIFLICSLKTVLITISSVLTKSSQKGWVFGLTSHSWWSTKSNSLKSQCRFVLYFHATLFEKSRKVYSERNGVSSSWRERNWAKLISTDSSLWWLLWAFLQGGIVVVAAKSVIQDSVCHAKIHFWIAGKWIKGSLMAAACANATLLLCAWQGNCSCSLPWFSGLTKCKTFFKRRRLKRIFNHHLKFGFKLP